MANHTAKADWNKLLKKRFTANDAIVVAVNLIPLLGVWLWNWNAKEMFVVYCLESVIVGLYNVILLLLATHVRKKDVFNEQTGSVASGYFFIFFFIIHYGFFLFVQLTIFLSVINFADLGDFGSAYKLLFNFPQYLSKDALLVLLGFVVSYGIMITGKFVLTGKYKTTPMGLIMFMPYPRIFVQQFVVILGSFVLMFGAEAGKVFMLVFVVVKVFFEMFVDYERLLTGELKSSSTKA